MQESLEEESMPWQWVRGRFGQGRKLLLARGARWDIHLLEYPRGTVIPEHVDPIAGRHHVRINVCLAGKRQLHADAIFRLGAFILYHSDRPHRLDAVPRHTLVLSAGVAL